MRHRARNSEHSTGSVAAAAARTGKHRAPDLKIPAQTRPTHDMDVEAPPPLVITPQAIGSVLVPDSASWEASHLPRNIAGTLLALAVLGTSGLGVRYAQSLASDDFVSLVVGLVVGVVLWGVMIASTPQVVSLEKSILTVANTGGSERFDLADALQSVDLVGNPRTSHWAVLLHRPNDTTIVLRHADVLASELDPIVRHYRSIVDQRYSERQARFNR